MKPALALTFCAILPLACVCHAQEEGIMLSTDRPGNLFGHGSAVVIQVQAEGVTEAAWTLTDYDGLVVREGRAALAEGRGSVALGELPRGYYELTCGAGDGPATLAFGVITDHSGQAPASGRLNVDGATAWLAAEGQHEPLARMLRMAGIGWVRERFSWGATEPEKGKEQYQGGGRNYDAVADAYSAQGVRVYQIWHDSPGWTHPDNRETRNPEDLRDVYNFARRVAERYKGRVQAWEVWNEPDIGFWPDLGDTFAGLQKAAYLGFKAADPDLPVLLGSFCRGYCPFDESLFEAGIADYFDVFNWHIYAPPEAYPGVLAGYLQLLSRYGCADRPVWLTEAGIRLRATQPGGELTAEDERRQAEFVPQSFAWSLAAGTDRHFFFVYPYYLEGEIQFGALRKGLSPRPGFVAIATCVDLLGEATYLGRYDLGDPAPDVTGLAFDSGKERVLVIWSKQPTTVRLAVGARQVEIADVVGRRNTAEAPEGTLALQVGPSPQYVLGLGDAALAFLRDDVRPPGKLPRTYPQPVVLRGQARVADLDKNGNLYLLGQEPFTYVVEVCNLSQNNSATGLVRIETPEGWAAEPGEAHVALEPMDRAVLEYRITPAKPRAGTHKLWARGVFKDGNPSPSVSYFRFDPTRVEPASILDLELNSPAAWTKNITGLGTMDIGAGTEGGLRFDIRFTAPGDWWCYPRVIFDPPRDWSAYDGLEFHYRCHGDDGDTIVRVQVVESGGSSYLTGGGWPARAAWARAACLFGDLSWGSHSPPDPNARLDTNQVATLMIGLNTKRDAPWLEVRDVRLFRLAE